MGRNRKTQEGPLAEDVASAAPNFFPAHSTSKRAGAGPGEGTSMTTLPSAWLGRWKKRWEPIAGRVSSTG